MLYYNNNIDVDKQWQAEVISCYCLEHYVIVIVSVFADDDFEVK